MKWAQMKENVLEKWFPQENEKYTSLQHLYNIGRDVRYNDLKLADMSLCICPANNEQDGFKNYSFDFYSLPLS